MQSNASRREPAAPVVAQWIDDHDLLADGEQFSSALGRIGLYLQSRFKWKPEMNSGARGALGGGLAATESTGRMQ